MKKTILEILKIVAVAAALVGFPMLIIRGMMLVTAKSQSRYDARRDRCENSAYCPVGIPKMHHDTVFDPGTCICVLPDAVER